MPAIPDRILRCSICPETYDVMYMEFRKGFYKIRFPLCMNHDHMGPAKRRNEYHIETLRAYQ